VSPLPLHALRESTRSHGSHQSAPGRPRNEPGDVARGRIEGRLEALLADLGSQLHRGESLASRDREQPPRCSSGVPEIDHLLGGGFPRGRLSEISGPPSSGRTSLALALLAATTRSGELAAVVDQTDAFDPPSAERAGVDLKRVLWVRALTWREALRCTERLLKTDGFPLVVLDLACISHQVATATADLGALTREISTRLLDVGSTTPPGPSTDFSCEDTNLHGLATRPGEKCGLASCQREHTTTAAWIRLARLAAGTQTAVVLLSAERLAGSYAEIALKMQPVRARFTGTPALLEELETRAVLVRHRTAPANRETSLRLACAEETGPTTPR